MTTTQAQTAGAGLMWAAPGEAHSAGWAVPARGDIGTLPSCRVRRVTEYIQQNLDKTLMLAELAAVVHMSPYHFARLFKLGTGLPPHRFVVGHRIARARALLAARELSIQQISRMVGFQTPSHFTTVFRRVTGITPGAFRRESLRQDEAARQGGRDDLQ